MALKIKFGPDGWRAIIAEDFTVENVARVAQATGTWLKAKYENPRIVVGHDCRFAGELFVDTAVRIFLSQGIHVKMTKGIVSTPMISLGAKHFDCGLGIIFTASHNPPAYHGYKIKAYFGGPLQPELVQEIEDIIPEQNAIDFKKIDLDEAMKAGQLEVVDLETLYVDHVKANFDLDAIKKFAEE